MWAHTISPDGDSEGLPAHVVAHAGDETREVDLGRSGSQIVLSLASDRCRVELAIGERGTMPA